MGLHSVATSWLFFSLFYPVDQTNLDTLFPEVWRLGLPQKYRFNTVHAFNGVVFDQNSPTVFVNEESHLSLAFAILDLANQFAAHPERCQHQNQQPRPAWIRPQTNAFDFFFRLGKL